MALLTSRRRLASALALSIGARRHHHVVFFGSDEVSCATLERLLAMRAAGDAAVRRLDVVCPSDRPQGRGRALGSVPVKQLAARHLADASAPPGLVSSLVEVPYGLRDLATWADGLARLRELGADLGVVVSFGYFMPAALLDGFRLGAALNMHPSLLPRHRGAAPVPHTLLAGDAETGVSVIDVHRGRFDAGAVLLQRGGVVVGAGETSGQLTRRLAAEGADAVEAVLRDYERLRAAAQPQSEAGATRAPKLRPEAGLVTLARLRGGAGAASAGSGAGELGLRQPEALLRLWRALEDSVGLHCFVDGGRRLKLLELAAVPPLWRPAAAATAAQCGDIVFDKSSRVLALAVGGEGGAPCEWVRLVRVQLEFKRAMSGEDFGRGGVGGGSAGAGAAVLRVVDAVDFTTREKVK